MKVIWSPKAITSMERLAGFLDYKWGKKVTDNLLDEIDKVIAAITQNPALYPLYSNEKHIRKCVIKKRTLLFYKVIKSELHILLVVDSRQNPQNFFF